MDSRFGKPFGDADLLVLGEDDAGLLLTVAQRDVVYLDVLGKTEVLDDFVREIPRAYEPFLFFPGLRCHV